VKSVGAFAARDVPGSQADTTSGCAFASVAGTRSTREESALRAGESGQRPNAFGARSGRLTTTGMKTNESRRHDSRDHGPTGSATPGR